MSTLTAVEASGAAPNYRQHLAAAVPALVLGYVILLWPLLYGGATVAADVNQVVSTTSGSYLLNRLFFPGIFAVGLMLFLAERPRLADRSGALLITFALFWSLCGVSALWALAPGKTVSQFGLITIGVGGVALAMLVAGSMERAFRMMFWVIAAAMVINLALVLTRPPGPIGHQGLYDHKNTLGAVAAAAVFFALWGLSQDGPRRAIRYASILMIPVALYVLWKSESKTSLGLAVMVPVLALALFVAVRSLRMSLPVVLSLMVLLALAGAWFLGRFGFTLGDVSQVVSGDPTFTGRTELWGFAVDHIVARPWLGYGFRSFWQIGDLSPQLAAGPGFLQRTPNGHNGYLDMLLQVGVVGFALFACLLLAVAGRIGRVMAARPFFGYVLTTIFLFIILHGLLESTWFEILDPVSILFLFLLVAPLGEREQTR